MIGKNYQILPFRWIDQITMRYENESLILMHQSAMKKSDYHNENERILHSKEFLDV